MPSQIALLFCAVFVCIALIIDSKRPPNVSNAIWIPVIWTTFLASKPLTAWLYPGSVDIFADPAAGSPVDRNFLSFLMLLALAVLIKRNLPWAKWVRQNPWLFAFLLYCGVSIVWSDFPLLALRRSIRGLGTLMMVLILASEKDPLAAIAAVVRRCSLILVPLSIVTIKYFREYAVEYNYWDGQEYLVGVTSDKNALGRLCMISALFGLWELVTKKYNKHIHVDALNKLINIGVYSLALWLLVASNSKTSLFCFLIGLFILLLLGLPKIRGWVKNLGILLVPIVAAMVILMVAANLLEVIVGSLGRDLTFTDRTFLWEDLLALKTNPVLGVGYESFWLGDRLETFVRLHLVNEAHNGFLEVYLELGFLGLFLFAGVLVSVLKKAQRSLITDVAFGNLRIVALAVFVLYNLTESGYKLTTFMGLILTFVALEAPATRAAKTIKRVSRGPARRRKNVIALPGCAEAEKTIQRKENIEP